MVDWFLVLDVGTTQIKGFVFDFDGNIKETMKVGAPLRTPRHGYVEQDAVKLWEATKSVIDDFAGRFGKPKAIGLTTQRASTIVWDRSGEPLYPIITWQDRRSADLAEKYSKLFSLRVVRGLGKFVSVFTKRPKSRSLKYLVTLANFKFGPNQPIMQLKWLFDNVEGLYDLAVKGELFFGTIDSWILYNLTGGEHITDYSNASATGLFDPFYLKWSDRLTKMVGIPRNILPRLVDSMGLLAKAKYPDGVPITSIIADQQSSLFSVAGINYGVTKITLGTGGFMDISTGGSPAPTRLGTFPLVYVKKGDEVLYMLEGIIQSVGSAVDFLLKIGMINSYEELYDLAFDDDCEVVFLPILAGLGTPYWEPNARAIIYGFDRSTDRFGIAKALLEGIAFRFSEVLSVLEEVSGIHIDQVFVDGNAARIDSLLQAMADYSYRKILRVDQLEGTARGAFLLAKAGLLGKSLREAFSAPKVEREFLPERDKRACKKRLSHILEEIIEEIR